MMMKTLIAALALLIAAGCSDTDGAGPAEPVDTLDDCFTCGWARADAMSLTRYQEAGVLDLVNTASRRVLDDDVALDARAANNIVDARIDNGDFETLAALDDVAYVGKSAFQRLVNYAIDHDFVGACGDGELQSIETCDDLNDRDGDGCSSTCQLEGGETVHGIAEGSPEALAVLHVVNTASRETLDVDIRLDRRAAANIYNTRPFATLLELDEVPYVAESAFELLLDYAQENAMLCTSGEIREFVADVNSTTWNSSWSREIRTNMPLSEAIKSSNWPAEITHAGCYGVRPDDLPAYIPVGDPEDNTRLMRLFQAYASAARRMGNEVNLDGALEELSCETEAKEFIGCRFEFEPNPWTGISWHIVESTDGSVSYLFAGEWAE